LDQRAAPGTTRLEGWVALLVALVLAALPIRAALFDADTVLFGVDTACAQLPWSTGAPANPELSDQGMVFYPAYREVSRRWRAGELPLWNPWAYAGAPLLANPQLGALDPQVLLPVALEALTGRAGFDRGLTWMAWLRLAAAGLGAYLLARELGLLREGAALAGVTFGGSGFVVLWLNHSLGHVAPLLPWVLLGVERARGARGFALCALALALAIYGGHPETSFYVGAAAGVWALALLRRDARHGRRALGALALGTLLAAPLLVPFVEYLRLSGARLARAAQSPPPLELVALGALLVAVAWARDLRAALAEGAGRGAALARNLVFLALLAVLAATVDWPAALGLLVLPDLHGTPAQAGGWRGAGSFLESACAWVPAASLALALAAALAPGPSRLRRRGVLLALTAVALALALRLPGLDGLHARLPGLGASAPVRLAVVSALGLALLAGEALERAPRAACAAAASLVAAGALAAAFAPRAVPPTADVVADAPDGLVQLVRPLPARAAAGALELELWLHPGIPEGAVGLVAERVDEGGAWRAASAAAWPLVRDDALARAAGAPDGARGYRLEGLDARALAEGTWRLTLALAGPAGLRLGDRVLGGLRIERRPDASIATWLFVAASLIAVARLGAGGAAASRRLVVAVAALQALAFAERQNPAVALERIFPPTRTETILRRELSSGGRFLADPGILPPGTSVALGLRCADGYDAMDPASFDQFRHYVVKEGAHPLLGFTPSGVDLDSPAFALLGVHALLTRAPLEHAAWRTIAGPDLPEQAEVYIAVPLVPPPRAFLVGRTRALADVASSPAALRASDFEPFEEVLLEDPTVWQPSAPLLRGEITSIEMSENCVELVLDLEGEGLLVLTDQAFPGWGASSDSEPRPPWTVNGAFRAVAVRTGVQRIVFRYRPVALLLGTACFGVAVSVLVLLLARSRSSSGVRPS
jgi:hypothetical protein